MAKRENIIPYAPIKKLIQDATGKRVSKEAMVTATKLVEEKAEKIIIKAKNLAELSNRKTVKAKDIRLAYSQLKEGF